MPILTAFKYYDVAKYVTDLNFSIDSRVRAATYGRGFWVGDISPLQDLPPGRYTVAASLTGFNTYRNESIEVTAGTSVPLKIGMTNCGSTARTGPPSAAMA